MLECDLGVVRFRGRRQRASGGGRLQAAAGFNRRWGLGLRFKLSLSLSVQVG